MANSRITGNPGSECTPAFAHLRSICPDTKRTAQVLQHNPLPNVPMGYGEPRTTGVLPTGASAAVPYYNRGCCAAASGRRPRARSGRLASISTCASRLRLTKLQKRQSREQPLLVQVRVASQPAIRIACMKTLVEILLLCLHNLEEMA